MKSDAILFFVIAIGLGVYAILAQLWPGDLSGIPVGMLIFLIGLVVVPLLIAWGIVLIVRIARRWKKEPDIARPAAKMLALSLTVLFGSCIICAMQLPRRIVFASFSRSFDALRVSLPVSDGLVHRLDSRVGIWHVDRYGVDERGGVYFRIGSSPDFVDTWSYGFAYKPNSEGSPFGRCGYWYSKLFGDWHYFKANSDY